MRRRRSAIVATLGMLAAASILAISTPAQATTSGCASDVGKKVPVVLVHGFLGSAGAWTSSPSSMVDALSRVPGIYVSRPVFDYSKYNKRWIDDSHIGPALAKQIACLATSSRQAGGSGKVIVVAHSMGGLVARWAATGASNAKEVANDIGLVVTIGTPNIGSGWANVTSKVWTASKVGKNDDSLCSQVSALYGLKDSSDQIAKLPKWPSGIAVKAIAGDVTVNLPAGLVSEPFDTSSDLVVSKKSAQQYMTGSDSGGGKATVSCVTSAIETEARVAFGPATGVIHLGADGPVVPDCWHSALTRNPVVKADTMHAIEDYLASLTEIPSYYLGDWGGHARGMTISKNGSGTFSYRDYDCKIVPPSSDFPMCEVTEKLRVSRDGSKVVAVVVSSHEEANDSTTGKTFAQKDNVTPVGTRYTLGKPFGNTQILVGTDGKSLAGAFNMCRGGSPDDMRGLCGA